MQVDLEKYAAELSRQYGSDRLTVKRLAEVKGWSEKTVRRFERRGVLPQRGKDGRFSVLMVTIYLEGGGLPVAEQRSVKRARQKAGPRKITKDW